jgi:hypothetical protein
VWELQRIYQAPSSWIIQHGVQEDGSLYMATRIDPLFLALPLLERGRGRTAESEGRFMQLDQLLPKADFPAALLGGNANGAAAATTDSGSPAAVSVVGGRVGRASVYDVCDKRDGWNEPVVRLSDAKVVAWLRRKVARLVHQMKTVPSLKHLFSPAELAETAEQTAEKLAARGVPVPAPSAANGTATPAPVDGSSSASAASAASASAAAASSAAPAAAVAASEAASSCSSAAPAAALSSSSSSSPSPSPPSSSLKQALQFLSEYITPALLASLLSSYALTPEDVFERRRAAAAAAAKSYEVGKISGDIDTSRPAGTLPASLTSGDKRKSGPEKSLSSAAKKLASAAKGTKSLSSFFAAAPKKPSA